MASLSELHAALAALKQDRKTAKVFFYFVGDEDHKLHSGFFLVEQGDACYVSYLQKPPGQALEEIPRLPFSKVTTLPAMQVDHSADPYGALPLDLVLERLDPALQPEAAPAMAPPPPPQAAAAPVHEAPKPHVFYSHVALQKDATELLETLYGRGAAKKVEEFAHASPPHQYPAEFLKKCAQHAAMMLGAKKADELFQPLHDKLANK